MTFCLWRCLCLTAPLYTYLLNTKNTNSSTKHCNICEWCPMSLFFEGLQWMLRLLFLSVRNVQRSLELLFECVLFLTLTLFWLSNISCRSQGLCLCGCLFVGQVMPLHIHRSQSVSGKVTYRAVTQTNIKTLSYCIPSVYKLRWIWSKCWGSGGNSRLHPAQCKLKIAVREKMWKYSFLIQLKAVCSQKPFRIILGLLKHLVQPPHVTTKTIYVM